MKKILSILIESLFWIQFFITPLGIGALIAMFIYINSEKLLWLSIVITVISAILGVVYAEKARRKKGTSRYASRIIGTPDIWPDEYPEELESSEKEKQLKAGKKKDHTN